MFATNHQVSAEGQLTLMQREAAPGACDLPFSVFQVFHFFSFFNYHCQPENRAIAPFGICPQGILPTGVCSAASMLFMVFTPVHGKCGRQCALASCGKLPMDLARRVRSRRRWQRVCTSRNASPALNLFLIFTNSKCSGPTMCRAGICVRMGRDECRTDVRTASECLLSPMDFAPSCFKCLALQLVFFFEDPRLRFSAQEGIRHSQKRVHRLNRARPWTEMHARPARAHQLSG